MDYNDFKEFFKVHVKQYGPYRDSKLFQSFSNFLMDSYYNDSYTNIPTSFKSAFENQVLDSDYVIPFLLSLGIPSSEIDKISNSDRFKIINTISDFHRYKGTITLIDKLITNFDVNDNMAVYELYLDMHIDIAGSKVWEVLPNLIKAGSSTRKSLLLNTPQPFSMLDKAPNWFIDELTLGDLYDAGEMELPYKTNCILLDSTIFNRIEPVIQIVSSLVVETLKNDKIQLFFSDGVYLTTFSNMNILWYYIFHKLNSVGNTTLPSIKSHLLTGQRIFDRYVIPNLDGSLPRNGSDSLSASLTNIQSLIDGYANLSTSDANSKRNIDTFYNDNIDIFSTFNTSKTSTFNEYRSLVSSIVGVELLNYIDNRLANSQNMFTESGLIHSEIYNSILSYKSMSPSSSNNMDMDYLDYYFLNLPGLIKDIKNSTSYIMLNLLKPYHVDLLDSRNHRVVADSKFNNALVGYTKIFQTIYSELTNANLSENSIMKPTTSNYDSARILNAAVFSTIYNSLYDPSLMLISHNKLFSLTSMYSSISNISEYLKDFGSTTIGKDNLLSLGASTSRTSSLSIDTLNMFKKIILSLITSGSSHTRISYDIKSMIGIAGFDPFSVLSNTIYNITHPDQSSNFSSDAKQFKSTAPGSSVNSISDQINQLLVVFRHWDSVLASMSTSFISNHQDRSSSVALDKVFPQSTAPGSSVNRISDQINQLLVIFRYWDGMIASMSTSFISNHRDQSSSVALDKVFPQSTAPGSSVNSISDYNTDPKAILRYMDNVQNSDFFNNLNTSYIFDDIFIQIEKQLNNIIVGFVEITSPSDVSSQFGTYPNYDNIPVTDVVTSYIYDNPVTGVHTVYTN